MGKCRCRQLLKGSFNTYLLSRLELDEMKINNILMYAKYEAAAGRWLA